MNLLHEVKRVFSPYLKGEGTRHKGSVRKLLEKIDASLEQRDLQTALALARGGEELFPGDPELDKACRYLEKEEQKRELETILAKLKDRPNPVLYARAATLYLALGQMDQAMGIAEQALKRFPGKEDPYLVLGKIRWARFRKDLVAKGGREALENLEKAAALNPQNLNVQCLLGEIHLALGSSKRAMEYFSKVKAEPGWDHLDALIDQARNYPDAGKDNGVLLRKVEQEGRIPFPYWETDSSGEPVRSGNDRDESVSLDKAIQTIEKHKGVLQTFLVNLENNEKAAEKSHPLVKGVSEISRYAEMATRRMDLGNLRNGTIEGPFGILAFRAMNKDLIAIVGEAILKSEQALALLEEGEESGKA